MTRALPREKLLYATPTLYLVYFTGELPCPGGWTGVSSRGGLKVCRDLPMHNSHKVKCTLRTFKVPSNKMRLMSDLRLERMSVRTLISPRQAPDCDAACSQLPRARLYKATTHEHPWAQLAWARHLHVPHRATCATEVSPSLPPANVSPSLRPANVSPSLRLSSA